MVWFLFACKKLLAMQQRGIYAVNLCRQPRLLAMGESGRKSTCEQETK